MMPFAQALESLGLSRHIAVLPVQSGYPSPKYINLVLRRAGGTTYLFESSAARPDIVDKVHAALAVQSVERLDALLVTRCHDDHAGGSGIVAGYGRPEGYLGLEEHRRTRQISFRLEQMPPGDYMERRFAEDPGPVPVHRPGRRIPTPE